MSLIAVQNETLLILQVVHYLQVGNLIVIDLNLLLIKMIMYAIYVSYALHIFTTNRDG